MESDPKRNALEKETCIVLRAVPYREADLILSLFSRTNGLISARAWGARSLKSANRAACQPFCVSEMEFYVKGGRRSLKAAEIRNPFFGIQERYASYAAGCVLLEATEKVLAYGQDDENEALFRLLGVCLGELEHAGSDPWHVLLYFLIRVVHMMGIFPPLGTCASCGGDMDAPGFWSSSAGGAICEQCAPELLDGEELPLDTLLCLATYGRGKIGSETDAKAGDGAVRRSIRFLADLLRDQFGMTLRTLKGVGV